MNKNLSKKAVSAGLTLGAADTAERAAKWLKSQGLSASKTSVVSEAVTRYWEPQLNSCHITKPAVEAVGNNLTANDGRSVV